LGEDSARTILGSAFKETFRPAWSPTGDMIIFDLGENGQIGSKLLQTNQYETIETPLELLENPGFSADASWLVFNGTLDTADQDIFIMLRTGEELIRLTDSPANDYQPVWRP
jgi:Tol biopolymer transport system component